jgi:hypothetical protein
MGDNIVKEKIVAAGRSRKSNEQIDRIECAAANSENTGGDNTRSRIMSAISRLATLPLTGISTIASMLTTSPAFSFAESQRVYPSTLIDAPTAVCRLYLTIPTFFEYLFPSLKTLDETGRIRLATKRRPSVASASTSDSILNSDASVLATDGYITASTDQGKWGISLYVDPENEVEVSLLGAVFMTSVCGYLLFEIVVLSALQ